MDEEYPRWVFHRTERIQLVQSRAEEDALGPEWARSPWPEVRELPVTRQPAEPLPAVSQAVQTKECSKCRETKPVSEFYRQGRRLHAQCKGCINAYLRDRAKTHPRKRKAQPRAGGGSPRLITGGAAHPIYMRVEFTADFELFGMRFRRGDSVEMNKDLAARAIRAGVAAVQQEPGAA